MSTPSLNPHGPTQQQADYNALFPETNTHVSQWLSVFKQAITQTEKVTRLEKKLKSSISLEKKAKGKNLEHLEIVVKRIVNRWLGRQGDESESGAKLAVFCEELQGVFIQISDEFRELEGKPTTYAQVQKWGEKIKLYLSNERIDLIEIIMLSYQTLIDKHQNQTLLTHTLRALKERKALADKLILESKKTKPTPSLISATMGMAEEYERELTEQTNLLVNKISDIQRNGFYIRKHRAENASPYKSKSHQLLSKAVQKIISQWSPGRKKPKEGEEFEHASFVLSELQAKLHALAFQVEEELVELKLQIAEEPDQAGRTISIALNRWEKQVGELITFDKLAVIDLILMGSQAVAENYAKQGVPEEKEKEEKVQASSEIAKAKARLDELLKQNTSLKTKVNNQKKEISNTKERAGKAKELSSNLKQVRLDLQQLESDNENLVDQVKDLSSQLDSQKTASKADKARIANLQSKLGESQEVVKTSLTRNQELSTSLSEARNQFKQLNVASLKEREALETRLQRAVEAENARTQELATLKSRSKEELAKRVAVIPDLEKSIEKLHTQLKEALDAKGTAEAKLQFLRQQRKKESQQDLSSDLRALKAQVEANKRALSQPSGELALLREQNAELVARCRAQEALLQRQPQQLQPTAFNPGGHLLPSLQGAPYPGNHHHGY